jgi:methylated-DNA-[protein]-cysteine S-methyltransferase
MFLAAINSPVGLIEIQATDTGIASLFFREQPTEAPSKGKVPKHLKEAVKQLEQYFRKERTDFELPLDPQGTDFQRQVWQELQSIPFGKTCTYLDLSRKLNNEKAVRAVGTANGSNPISLFIPCHRVIGTNGKLIGYGGGLWRKEWLLNFENAWPQAQLFGGN